MAGVVQVIWPRDQQCEVRQISTTGKSPNSCQVPSRLEIQAVLATREVCHTLNPVHRTGDPGCETYLHSEGRWAMTMFKASVIAFTVFICGAMLTIAHYDAHFAQLPKSVLAKRAA